MNQYLVFAEINMRGEFWLINHRRDIPDVIKNFHNRLNEMDFSRPIAWRFESYSTVRSLSQNALFHMWCGQMAEYFSSKIEITPEMVKKLMKNEFLGTEDIHVGSTVIENQLRSTSSLSKGEMHEFMEKVFHWGLDKGVQLANPADSEFMRGRDAQG